MTPRHWSLFLYALIEHGLMLAALKARAAMAHRSPKGMFTVSLQYGPKIALIACSGPATVAEIHSTLCFAGEIARRSAHPRILFDLLALRFEGPPAQCDEMEIVAPHLKGVVDRIAVVMPPELNLFDCARSARSPLNVHFFGDLPDAFKWLGG
jgi:hypothetical protein